MVVKGQTIAALVLEVGKEKTVLYNFGTGRLNTIPSHKPKKRKVAVTVDTILQQLDQIM